MTATPCPALRRAVWLAMSLLIACGDSDGTAMNDTTTAVDADAAADAVTPTDVSADTGGDTVDAADSGPDDDVLFEDGVDVGVDAGGVTLADLTLTTSDSKSIAATIYRPPTIGDSTAGVLLIHQFSQTRAQWDPYIADLTGRGHLVLTIDLRGHGDSDAQDGTFNSILTDPSGAPNDVRAGLAQLLTEGANTDKIAIIGTSIGANLTCVMAAGNEVSDLHVAVSARASSVAALAATAEADLTFSGLFILATTNDGGGAQAATADAFFDDTTPPREKTIYPGSAHGRSLLSGVAEAWPAILTWLDANL